MVYLDNSATTKPYTIVAETLRDVTRYRWANPSSAYDIADEANTLIENVRDRFASDLHCNSEEIVFTGGGCESNTLCIMGFLKANLDFDLYTTSLEHASINEMLDDLPSGVGSVIIPNDQYGFVHPDKLQELIEHRSQFSSKRPFVSITAANSEIGVKQDLKTIAEVVHKYNGVFHCDAVQLFPEQQIDVQDFGIDMMSISAQKFHGPRGAGVAFIRDGVVVKPVIYGTQENKKRGGTYNTAAICAMGKALELTRTHSKTQCINEMRDKLLQDLLKIPGTHLNGPPIGPNRLANNISITIDGVDSETLMTLADLSGVVIAKGSACQSYVKTPSRALLSIGLTEQQALSTIRITLSEDNTENEIYIAADILTELIERIRCNG